MSPVSRSAGQKKREGIGDRIPGVVVGIVKSVTDPEGKGRIQVVLPSLSGMHGAVWSRVAVPMPGKKRGFFVVPDPGDEVLVAFEHGDSRFPFIVGFLWDGEDRPPTSDAEA